VKDNAVKRISDMENTMENTKTQIAIYVPNTSLLNSPQILSELSKSPCVGYPN